ncbi:cGMP-specific phosphodiesterase, putative [Plasmodium ovale]|uniref:Phosphodiesterase n=1 Tax=Plasmodium ovale TaxID=36330 RepID=A0A1C3KWT8_PLAOA|nr:cGMP-specific phosphodiesterase, putative [Plasmodium ovale]
MDRKIDKEDNHGGEENEVRKRHKLFKELSKSFQQSERKYDDGELTKSFTFHDEFVKSGKYKSDNAKEYLWKKMKDGAKKKSQKEYDRCVRKDKLKFVCTARKYMKYFFDLRGKNYRSDSTSSYSSIGNSTCTVENCNSNCASVGGSIGMNQSSSISSLSMVNKKGDIDNANVVHGFGSMGSNGTSLNFVDYVKEKEEPFYEIYCKEKYRTDISLCERCMHIFAKNINFILKRLCKYSKKKDNISEMETCLMFKKENYEEIFLNKFYSSLPFKMIIHSITMILISVIHFFILYQTVLKFIYEEYITVSLSMFKLFLDIFYFLFFIIYIYFFNTNCIDGIAMYSYISSYFFTSFSFLHSIIMLQRICTLSPYSHSTKGVETSINVYMYQKYIIMMSKSYISIFCFLRNYTILYNFVLSIKYSFFCSVCLFLFSLYSCVYLKHYGKHTFFLFLLLLCVLFFSLYVVYKYEKRKRVLFINTDEQKMKRKQNNHLTKYFSIDNSIPTSPIEDILSNLKFLLDHINKLEEDANDKCKILLTKMKEKIKKCENILRTQNLNEVQICKYRKFERVYNMWCLDKNENSFEKDEESKTFSSHNVHKKSFNSFSHIHSLLSSKLQDHFNESYEWNANIEIVYKRNVFISIGYKLLYPLGVLELNFDKERLKKFLFKMYSLYNDVPYHNSLHAAQVAHFSKSMLFMLDMNRKISGIDEFCLHVSSLCHDVGHPGLNNYFLVNSENNLALTYNDNSVLENYHCSLVFKSLKDQNCNIFENYPSHIFTTCKKNIIRAILSTDMKNHFEYISNFRTSKEFIDYENMTNDQIWQTFCLILKAADIGHATLDWDKHFEWTIKINEEFYLQGLLEKSLNMTKSSLCDITTIDKLAASQIGFLKHLCIPLYNELNFISKNKVIYNNCICSIENNIEQWEKNENNQQTLGLEEKYKNENLVDRIKLLKVV